MNGTHRIHEVELAADEPDSWTYGHNSASELTKWTIDGVVAWDSPPFCARQRTYALVGMLALAETPGTNPSTGSYTLGRVPSGAR